VKSSQQKVLTGKLLLWILGGVTLLITPMFSLDAVNIPKSIVAITGGTVAAAFLLSNNFAENIYQYRFILTLSIIFVIEFLLVFLLSGSGLVEQFYGADGRLVGFAAYLSLVFILLYAISCSSVDIISKILTLMHILGFFSSVYGILQWAGADPVNWSNQYSPVMGFFGNPNYQSSFLGMCSVALISEVTNSEKKLSRKLYFFALLTLNLLVIQGTNSLQGIIVFLLGSAAVIYLKIQSSAGQPYRAKLYLLFVSVLAFIGIAGMLNQGPLSSILYKDSVVYRGDYWRAAFRIIENHPIFGVGFDQFGDWYRNYRDVEAITRRGPEVVSNSPHNVFLDYAVSGGIVLFFLYSSLVVYTFITAIKFIKHSKSYDSNFTFIFSVWLAYQAQSLIAVNQIGLTVWGWVFSGLVIGYKSKKQKPKENTQLQKGLNASVQARHNPLPAIIGLLIGASISMPLFLKDMQLRSALENGTVQQTVQAVEKWPFNANRAGQISSFLLLKGFPDDALNLARIAVQKSPRSFVSWKVIYDSPNSSQNEKEIAKQIMIKLDPLNPNLK
jgi:O-antigen ligase